VVGVQAGLVDGQGALVQGVGALEVALVSQDAGEVVEAFGGVGVVGAEAGLADRQGALGERGLGRVTTLLVDRGSRRVYG
jgi:hypothetical protein